MFIYLFDFEIKTFPLSGFLTTFPVCVRSARWVSSGAIIKHLTWIAHKLASSQ